MSYWRRCSTQSTAWLRAAASMHPQQNTLQHKMNAKSRDRFSNLLRHPVRKWNRHILKKVDKQGTHKDKHTHDRLTAFGPGLPSGNHSVQLFTTQVPADRSMYTWWLTGKLSLHWQQQQLKVDDVPARAEHSPVNSTQPSQYCAVRCSHDLRPSSSTA